ncbi:amino acid adenylation domain-containing protein [Yinghuangia sp. YIM S09857]|uniref:amino acid adenylation domain-containing protein n=1 Tax=Yinghuangia sp. YIM S09857 TaxID=3436929 RepID=UPI003F52F8F9
MSDERRTFDAEAVRRTVAQALHLAPDELRDAADLFEFGLDSLTLIRLAGGWRRAGIAVSFEDLVERPTLADWLTLLDERSSTAPRSAPAAAVAFDDEAPYPLATMQHAYWTGRQDGQPLGGVGAHFYTEFDGSGVDPVRLREALAALTRRHAMLRAHFTDDARQYHASPDEVRAAPVLHDLRDLSSDAVERRLAELRETWSHHRMDVAAGEVFRLGLSLLPEGRTRLHVDLDMIAGDAMSLRILLHDLRHLYETPDRPLPPIGIGYGRYLAEHAEARTDARDSAREWWRQRLTDLPAPPALPTVVDPLTPVHAQDTALNRTKRLHHHLDARAKAALLEHARRHGVAPTAALAAAFAEVIGAWSAGPRLLLNLPLFDREPLHPDVGHLVGDFSASIMLGVDTAEPSAFAERARRVQDDMHAAVAHGAYGGVEVLRDLSRTTGEPVLAPVVFTSAVGLGEVFDAEVQALFGAPVWIISQGPQVWLDAQVTELDQGLLLNWDVREAVFAPGVPEAAFAAFRDLVTTLVTDERAWLAPVGTLAPSTQLERRPEPDASAHEPRTLHGAFFAHAETAPARIAVVDGSNDAPWTYGRLAERARRLTTRLVRDGVRPGDTVAVTLPKGIDQIVAVLGVLAAGAAYVPVGVDQPVHRRRTMHRTARARVTVTDEAHAHLVDPVPDAVVVRIEETAGEAPAAVIAPSSPADIAYVIFTSGSTGVPKGVEVPHRAAANTIDAVGSLFGIGAEDRTLAMSALDFDLSVYDMFAFLSVGGSLVTVDEPHRRDAAHWAELVRRHGVSVLSCVPALLDMLVTAAAEDGLGSELRLVMLGGDWVGLDQPARLRALVPGCRFVALGGMTEAAIHSTVYEVHEVDPAWRSVPYGAPLPGTRARVADARGRDCPDWVVGELWVGGAGVADGYRGDPERTAARFVERDGTRWYRSGDLARYRDDGVLEFLGRADHQVKVRGHRIELGEIEAALESHPGVLHAVATVVEGPARRLAAAVSPDGPQPPDPAALRAWAAERIPPYMVPEHVHVWDAMPLTGNGKLDRRAVQRVLDRTDRARSGAGDPPEGEIETAVAKVWGELLDATTVTRDDGFFELGGDSLVATRMLSRLRAAGIAGASVAAVFTSPRLRDFAARLTTAPSPAAARAIVAADPAHRGDPFPLTEVQAAYLAGRSPEFTLGGVGTWHYSEFEGTGIDIERMQRAWRALIRRHDMLRAVIDRDGTQRVLADVPDLVIDVVDTDAAGAEAALAVLRAEGSHRVLDLGTWPLFEVRAVRWPGADGQSRTRLSIGLDYIVFDALSIMTLYTELDRLYRDPTATLPPIEVSFRDYLGHTADDTEAENRSREYWSSRIAELPPAPNLPLAKPLSEVVAPRFTRRTFRIPPDRWRAIREHARADGLTPSTLLLACYAEVLAAWSGSDAVTVTLTLFNRRELHPHIARVLGDFTALAPAGYRRADADLLPAATELQRQQALDLDHRDASPAWLLRELARRGDGEGAVPVVFTSAIGVGDGVSMDLSDTFPTRVWGVSQSPQVCLDNQVTEEDGGLRVTWDAVEEAFGPEVLDGMLDAYLRLLHHVADRGTRTPVPDLLPEATRAVRAAVNATETGIPVRTLHSAFFEHARSEPDAVALIAPDGASTTYGELADGALRIAAWLRARGVEPAEPVAVTLPKSAAQITAVLGVLAAAGTYVPVGTEQPPVRRERILSAAGVRVVLDREALAEALTAEPLPAPVETEPHRAAYVIFTSGSTGEPKGVEMTHAAVWNTVADVRDRHRLGPRDRVLALSALDFDLSVFDVFGLLSVGGALVLPHEDDRREPATWRELVREHRVTVWNTVPVLLDMLLAADENAPGGDHALTTLRAALVSGDWIGLDLPGRLRERTAARCRFTAMGGATEAAIWSNSLTVHAVPPTWTSIPYGHPLANQRFRVCDRAGRDVPDLVVGELWIGGAGLATGYRGDPRRTAAKFVTRDRERWYRTGDLGRYWPDGTLEFLGRADEQAKIGGNRIEPGEVENALLGHPGVTRAAVVAIGGRAAASLVAFVTVEGTLPEDLMSWTLDRLPPYAIPTRVTVLESLPLTGNGKVDRGALRELAREAAPHDTVGEAPSGDVERAVAALWAEHLGVAVTDRHANFFALGGDSLAAIRVAATVERRFGVPLPTRHFLAAPTVAALATRVAAHITTGPADAAEFENGVL